jgi:peptide/nickel transport system permease protein
MRAQGFPTIPIAILLGVLLVAIFANVIAPHNPEVGVLGDRFRPPAWQANGTIDHLLGTDHLGRDVLSRLIFGARISVIVGLMVVVVAGFVGTALGSSRATWAAGSTRSSCAHRRLARAARAHRSRSSWPAIIGPSATNIIIILALVYWTRYARVIRGEVLSVGNGTSCASPSSPAARSGRSCASTSCRT